MPRRTVRERICGLCPGGKRVYSAWERFVEKVVLTRSSAIAERPRDASCQLKPCQLPRNSAEITCTTSPEPSISCS